MVLFFSIFFAIYAAINYYIFIRGWQALEGFPHLRIFYLIIFVLLAFAYIAAKFLVSYLPLYIYNVILWIGSFWFAFMLYFFISIFLIDFLRLLNWKLEVFPVFVKENYLLTKHIITGAIVFFTFVIIFLGYLNTRSLKVKTLNLEIARGACELDELNVVMASDIHLSPMDNELLLEKIVGKINELKPDIILLAGDIVDDKPSVLYGNNIGDSFSKLKSKYGVYAATGNHEFITGIKEAEKYIENHNINLLRDSLIKFEDGFVVAARDDRSKKNFTGEERLPLNKIINNSVKEYPIILMDHTPFGLEEAENNGVALQLSGHVHNGQLYPLNYITRMIYEKSWGYLNKGKTQYYISCGVGTWGPPVRTGSYSEIVNLKIKFIP
ncbi:MAG: metallophosphoesterase [Ignavibacteriaceae bacterium]